MDNDMIGRMVEETFSETNSEYNVLSCEISYMPKLKTFRLTHRWDVIDFPLNWSIFSKESHDVVRILRRENDESNDYLISILNTFFNENFEKVILKPKDKILQMECHRTDQSQLEKEAA